MLPSPTDPTAVPPSTGCAWWNLACKGAEHVANSGLSAITKSIASGAEMLLSEIVKVIDDSATVPLADPTYRHIYVGFLGLAATLIGIVLSIALIVACLRRDFVTLGRAVAGIVVASLGGALYIVFAQVLVAIDDWLSHGVVRVTGYNLTQAIDQIAVGFHQIAGAPGEMAANMLLLMLMLIMLVSGLILWFVLVLRKMAILVVVAFAPLLIAGYLWAPTRSWVRKTTEVLVALVFTKTAIFTLFGIGLALLSRGADQSLSDFVGTTVLMCGACFAPLMMLRLVHFAADTHLAGDAIGSLRGGMQPVARHLPGSGGGAGGSMMGRGDMARMQAQAPRPHGPGSPQGPQPVKAGAIDTGPNTPAASGAPSGPAGAGGGSGPAAGGAGAGVAGGVAGGVAAGVALAGKAALDTGKAAGRFAGESANQMGAASGPGDRPMRGPSVSDHDTPRGENS